ncbi:MAG: tRNA (N(6)-L-threonylcarbamoyladenosine(37)-C(2))-methylthiotransferase MtaB [Patescibacteria group bacterium]|nr:tRNA (N(6)-L-threonylcarbamoyladenosine(37)-C(2))-methylthiotransferase MtaB [Patescibacteria group bacterium]
MSIKSKNRIIFQISTLGCKVNQYDSAVLKNLLLSGNFILAKNNKDLDLVIINSCSVTKTAISKSRRLINYYKKKYPKSKIVLIGCWPKVYQVKNISSDLKVDLVLEERDLKKVSKSIEKIFFPNLKSSFRDNKRNKNKQDNFYCSNKINSIEDRSRYFIKVQDGCRQFCSYCIIPLARGPLLSRSSSDIVREITLAVKSGFSEIVLSGIHLGLYGQDFSFKKENLYSLLLKILKIKNIGRVRLSSIEVTEISDDLIELIFKNRKMCRHLHIPLQSGSAKILQLMNRPYTNKYFLNKINKIRKKIPNIAISTDIIVGFPGEGVKEFRETYNFSKNIKFSKIHVFSFSAHEKTPAYFLPNHVDSFDIKSRSVKLRSLSLKSEKKYQQEIVFQYKKNKENINLLIEGFSGDKLRAKTEFYFDLFLPEKKIINKYNKEGRQIDNMGMLGKIVNYKL